MEITPAIPEDRQVIDSYGPGRFKIAKTPYEGPVIVFPMRVAAWTVDRLEVLTLESLAPVLSAEEPVELLLIGTGPSMRLVSSDLRAALKDRGVAVDFMATGAACRTFNVLLAEARPVAAALIPV
ncbi:Mth938-like domain-containing protein [Marivibrio halodurans]|uniref:Mth938-like domain-containing protein n=1 Tax=Marivibrio halodurans TaxID=2039722 RepID=A0A8J7UZU5_9PROT|nr:Mth938-like domain-containing protein [Marivibrio halodurans]MBP5856051.1 Mth938-like domain-containing protein [Marivibrio halodurans]